MSIIDKLNEKTSLGDRFDGVTTGIVVDTNDPQQMGRIRVLCPTLGDDPNEKNIKNIPWSSYLPPFGGATISDVISRGPEDDTSTKGGVAYGIWGIPKKGATAAIMCIDGNPLYRIWVGCLYGQNLPHTMPHGRYFENPIQVDTGDGKPEGPVSSNEEYGIEPLYTNLTRAFAGDEGTHEPKETHEWRTRGADYSVAGVNNDWLGESSDTVTTSPDDIGNTKQAYLDTAGDKKIHLQGYGTDREFDHDKEVAEVDPRVDSQVYSITTPGFHAMSMDDRAENTRMRFRSTTGHQIILDDTNERIYIATAGGDSWIEMDNIGNIDMHSERRVSIHAVNDINLTTEESFRVFAKKGIHMVSGEDIRMTSDTNIHAYAKDTIRMHAEGGGADADSGNIYIQSGANLHINIASDTFIESANNVHVLSGSTLFLTSAADTNINATGSLNSQSGAVFNIKSGAAVNIDSSAATNIKAGGDIVNTGSAVHFNGPPAGAAGAATAANGAIVAGESQGYVTNRVPLKEPFARRLLDVTLTDIDGVIPTSIRPGNIDFRSDAIYELAYGDPFVGKRELNVDIIRGKYWRR